MQTQSLGKTGLQIPPLVFGGNVFGWTLDESQSLDMLDDLHCRGFTAIDTADAYSRWVEGHSGGESETIIGKWLKTRKLRDSITLITKVGYDMGQGHKDLSAKYIAQACEDSLRRLQTDHIDLYFSHFDDERTAPEETLAAYDKLVQAGKVRNIGASNLSIDRIETSLEVSQSEGLVSYRVIQPEYNLYARQKFESDYAPLARKYKFGVITYFTLASGFLSGKYRDEADLNKSQRGGGMEKLVKSERGNAILNALDAVSKRHEVSPASVAIAWAMQNPEVTAPIVSATKAKHVDAFVEAVNLQLSKDDLQELDIPQLDTA
jgi:aryl-alcohol dehydrogenase-like predicted oxidoreductase